MIQKLQVTYNLQRIDFYFIEMYSLIYLTLGQTVLQCIYFWQSFAKKLELGY